VDYTTGNCRTNDMVSAALDRVLITNARKVLSGLRNTVHEPQARRSIPDESPQ
jgi:hypothetical protein